MGANYCYNDNHIVTYTCVCMLHIQINMLYTLNLHNVICQIYSIKKIRILRRDYLGLSEWALNPMIRARQRKIWEDRSGGNTDRQRR